jgi:hypothetical protein
MEFKCKAWTSMGKEQRVRPVEGYPTFCLTFTNQDNKHEEYIVEFRWDEGGKPMLYYWVPSEVTCAGKIDLRADDTKLMLRGNTDGES